MALKYIFTNNAESKLAVAMGGSDLTSQVESGDGALFPNPTPGTEHFTIQVVSGSQKAYMNCTSRSSDILTVTRSDSYSFPVGSSVRLVLTAAILSTFLQKGTEREVAGDPEVLETVAAYFGEEVFNTVGSTFHKDCDGTWKLMNGEGS
jgi:hypothetical protein